MKHGSNIMCGFVDIAYTFLKNVHSVKLINRYVFNNDSVNDFITRY